MNILELNGLSRTFVSGPFWNRTQVRAVDEVTLSIKEGEALALVGESGSGKTTIGRMIVGLETPDEGSVTFRGENTARLGKLRRHEFNRAVQMVFQNSQSAYNPRRRVGAILADAGRIHGSEVTGQESLRVEALLAEVGLDPSLASRVPAHLSGGQRQRVGIARALSTGPQLIVADEPVSALDVSVQAQVLNLFARLIREHGLAMLLVSHDLRAVYFLCQRIAVMYRGRIVEVGTREEIVQAPRHPYTRALIGSVPTFDLSNRGLTRAVLEGEIEDSEIDSGGCNFATRCDLRRRLGNPETCTSSRPKLAGADDHVAACHFADESGVTA